MNARDQNTRLAILRACSAAWISVSAFGVNAENCFAQSQEFGAPKQVSLEAETVPNAAAIGYEPIPLPPPSPKAGGATTIRSQHSSWRSVVASLAIVIGLFLAFVLLSRKTGHANFGDVLPNEAFEVIGRTSIAPRQQLHLVRLGRRLLLLNQADQRLDTLCEISAPEEVDHLMHVCGHSGTSTITAAVQDVLKKLR